MQIMAIFYSIIYIQYGAYTHHIVIGHSCVEYKEEVFVMIVYDRLWITLKKKNISQYALIKDYGIDKAQLQLQIAIQNGHLCHVRRSVCDIIGGQPKTN